MRCVKFLFAAGAATLLSTAAFAADMPMPPPYLPPAPAEFSGWYLRGDIGFSNQSVKRLESPDYSAPGITNVTTTGLGFDTAGIFGLGAGYHFNNWLRADVTGEYRGNANLHAYQVITGPGAVYPDQYTGSKSEWLVLANAYVDLGTWWCVTPFVGAGVGASRNTISNFTDTNVAYGSVASAPDTSKWSFAWALHAGLAYRISPSLTLELAYRYVDLGDGVAGAETTFDGLYHNSPTTFKNITSHDLKLGVRWDIEPPEPVYAPPLVTKG